MSASIFSIVILVSTLVIGTSTREIHINTVSGQDTPACLTAGPACQSLCYVSTRLSLNYSKDDSTSIILDNMTNFNALQHKTINFKNIRNMRLATAPEQQVTIRCPDIGMSLVFEHLHNLTIENISIEDCRGGKHDPATVQIVRCTNVHLRNVVLTNSSGVYIKETLGIVHFEQSKFNSNQPFGGLQLILTGVTQENTTEGANYLFEHCTFNSNYAKYYIDPNGTIDREWRYVHGGGMNITFAGNSSGNRIEIRFCSFTNNSAILGGGLAVQFIEQTYENQLIVSGSQYWNNIAKQRGGGVMVGCLSCNRNNFTFTNTTFLHNQAKYAGGASVFANYSSFTSKTESAFIFRNCTWQSNMATISPAFDMSPASSTSEENCIIPILFFTNCSVLDNKVIPKMSDYTSVVHGNSGNSNYIMEPSGVFSVTKSKVYFDGTQIFRGNKNSALHLYSSRLVLSKHTHLVFSNNEGVKGAALALYGSSRINFNDDIHIEFTNNNASDVGGAIYYGNSYALNLNINHKCFIQYRGDAKLKSKVIFEGNKAAWGGDSIFATSFYPCFFQWFTRLGPGRSPAAFFNEIGYFSFRDNNHTGLSTSGRWFRYNRNDSSCRPSQHAIPGKKLCVPLEMINEFYHTVYSVLSITVKGNKKCRVDPPHAAHTVLTLFGYPKDNITLKFQSKRMDYVLYHYLNISFLPCPPGYYHNESTLSCTCSVDTSHSYKAITKCYHATFTVHIQHQYWAGYIGAHEPTNLHTAVCPFPLCALHITYSHYNRLPNRTGDLEGVMCGETRRGILCGECQENYSVYYHSQHFKCDKEDLCTWGIVFYILSEIIPVVVLFVVVIAFNIRLTSGSMNGFIFYSQMLHTIQIMLITSDTDLDIFSAVMYSTTYGLLNFDFFNIEPLSFCLWKGSTVMDVLAFGYVTTTFSLCLVIFLVICLKYCRACRLTTKRKINISFTHGLTAFLCLSYTKCTTVTTYILAGIYLTKEGGKTGNLVTFFGGLPYMSGEHLRYAIPAIFFLFTIILPLPILLISYPLTLHLLSMCGLSEHWIVVRILRGIRIHQLMPLLDSFQSCFKDKMRFFAGLYFLYRLLLPVFQSYISHLGTAVPLMSVLGIHAIAQPYKERKHNVIDALLILNLVGIYGLKTAHDENHLTLSNTSIEWLQTFLVHVPIIVIIFWFLMKILHAIRRFIKSRKRKESESLIADSLDLDDLDRSEQPPYQEFARELSSHEEAMDN